MKLSKDVVKTLSKAVEIAMRQTAPGYHGWDELVKADALLRAMDRGVRKRTERGMER